MPEGQRDFQEQTGINIETDIDHVVVAVAPPNDASGSLPGSALVIARGRFDAVRIEGADARARRPVEDYKGIRLIVADDIAKPSDPDIAPDPNAALRAAPASEPVAAFVEPGVVAVGHSSLVRSAIDLKNGGDSVSLNDDMMKLVRSLERDTAWVVGRFDALASQAKLPQDVASQLPAITWVSASVRRQRRCPRHPPGRGARRNGRHEPARRHPGFRGPGQDAGVIAAGPAGRRRSRWIWAAPARRLPCRSTFRLSYST